MHEEPILALGNAHFIERWRGTQPEGYRDCELARRLQPPANMRAADFRGKGDPGAVAVSHAVPGSASRSGWP